MIISAKTNRGLFYAIQALRQLFPIAFENKTYNKATGFKDYCLLCVPIL